LRQEASVAEKFTVVHFNELTGLWHVEEGQGGRRWETAYREEAEAKQQGYERFAFPSLVLSVEILQEERARGSRALVIQPTQAATLSSSKKMETTKI
jgi:hypothetical protein